MSGNVPVDGDGMLVDFYDIKRAIDEWDHRHLNDIVTFVPTAELLAAEMQRRIMALLNDRNVEQAGCIVRLWETPTSWAQVGELVAGAANDSIAMPTHSGVS